MRKILGIILLCLLAVTVQAYTPSPTATSPITISPSLVYGCALCVVGPSSSTNGNIASYNGTTGKLIQDSGVSAASVVTGPSSAASGDIATFNGTTGKIVLDSGVAISGLPLLSASNTFTGLNSFENGVTIDGITGPVGANRYFVVNSTGGNAEVLFNTIDSGSNQIIFSTSAGMAGPPPAYAPLALWSMGTNKSYATDNRFMFFDQITGQQVLMMHSGAGDLNSLHNVLDNGTDGSATFVGNTFFGTGVEIDNVGAIWETVDNVPWAYPGNGWFYGYGSSLFESPDLVMNTFSRQLIGYGGNTTVSWDDQGAGNNISLNNGLGQLAITSNGNGMSITDNSYAPITFGGSPLYLGSSGNAVQLNTSGNGASSFSDGNAFFNDDGSFSFVRGEITADVYGNLFAPSFNLPSYGKIFSVYGGGAYSLNLHGGTDVNLSIQDGVEVYGGLGSGVAFSSVNDAGTANEPMQFRSGGGLQLSDWSSGALSITGYTNTSLDTSGNLTTASFKKTGGTSSQFLKADGSVDSNTYQATTITTHTSSYTIATTDNIVLMKANGATVTLPTSSSFNNKVMTIVTWNGAGGANYLVGNINGATVTGTTYPLAVNKSRQLAFDGTTWNVIGGVF